MYIVPLQVSNIQITQTVSNGMINLRITWNQPTSDHPIQHYELQYRKQGVSSWTSVTPNPTTRQTIIRNVDKGSVYNVQVRAVSDVGTGQWRSATSQRTYKGMNKIVYNCLFTILCYSIYVPTHIQTIPLTITRLRMCIRTYKEHTASILPFY